MISPTFRVIPFLKYVDDPRDSLSIEFSPIYSSWKRSLRTTTTIVRVIIRGWKCCSTSFEILISGPSLVFVERSVPMRWKVTMPWTWRTNRRSTTSFTMWSMRTTTAANPTKKNVNYWIRRNMLLDRLMPCRLYPLVIIRRMTDWFKYALFDPFFAFPPENLLFLMTDDRIIEISSEHEWRRWSIRLTPTEVTSDISFFFFFFFFFFVPRLFFSPQSTSNISSDDDANE